MSGAGAAFLVPPPGQVRQQRPICPSPTHFCFSASFLCSKVSDRRALLGMPGRRPPSVSVGPAGDVPSLCSGARNRWKKTHCGEWCDSHSHFLQTGSIKSAVRRINFLNSVLERAQLAGPAVPEVSWVVAMARVCTRRSSFHPASLLQRTQRLPLPSQTSSCLLGPLFFLKVMVKYT